MTRSRKVDPYDPLVFVSSPIKQFMTSYEPDSTLDPSMAGGPAWRSITHDSLAESFARSNVSSGRIDNSKLDQIANKLTNPVFWDVGPGRIKIRTGIAMLQNYNQMFPDADPLDLKRYNDRYDLFVQDLKNPDSDTTVKIAGLVAREGQDFFLKAMTPQRWAALSDDQKAAALTQYYVFGKEKMEDDFLKRGGNPSTYTPNFNRDGSDTYLYDPGNGSWSNPALLRHALSPVLRTQNDSAPQPGSTADSAADMNNAPAGQDTAAQRSADLSAPAQVWSRALPPQVAATGDYFRANGIPIVPRTVYMAHVIGPERTVDVIRRTGSTSSPDVPSADAATGRQVLAWVRALRGLPPLSPTIGAGPAGNGGGTPADDTAVQPSIPAQASAAPAAPAAFPLADAPSDTTAAANTWPQ